MSAVLGGFVGTDGNAETTMKTTRQLVLEWIPSSQLGVKKIFSSKTSEAAKEFAAKKNEEKFAQM